MAGFGNFLGVENEKFQAWVMVVPSTDSERVKRRSRCGVGNTSSILDMLRFEVEASVQEV